MPRIAIKADDYKIKDFSKKIRGKCAEEGIYQSDLAEVLNITQPAMSIKLKEGSFSLADFLKITKYLKFTDEEILKLVR